VDYDKKWFVMSAIGTGVILATIDGSIVNVALPTIRDQLDSTLPVVQWVAVAYLLTLATLTLGVGRWGDIVGKKRIYTTGFVMFTTASVLCGLAPSIEFLIGFRVFQAIGAVMVLALGSAILVEAFPPHERGKALGWVGTFVSIGVVTGPVVGGLLISVFDWRAIFFVNLPVGVIGGFLAFRYVPAVPPAGGSSFDLAGAATMSAALLCIALGVTSGQTLGYGDPLVAGLIVVGLSLIGVFVAIERRVASPMIQLALFRNPLLTVSIVSGFLVFLSISATFFLLPFFLEGVLGYGTRQTGLALGVPPLMIGVVAPFAGSWSDRVGVRRIALAGLTIICGAFAAFVLLDQQTTLLQYAAVAIPMGIGIGLFQSPNNSAIMGSMPREYVGVAGGILTLTRLLGQVSGIAILGSLWATRTISRTVASTGRTPTDAASSAPQFQVGGLHDTAIAMTISIALAIGIGWWGMRREREPERF